MMSLSLHRSLRPVGARLLPCWLTHYNFTRPHGSLSHKPPGTRLRELTNVPRNYI
jgi:transposase InsO family protein